MTSTSGNIEEVVLIIADISGYTQFMLKHKKEVKHSQIVISDLINSIIEKVEIPLSISKLEGDAVFIYSSINKHPDQNISKLIGKKLLQFYEAFERKLIELVESNACDCSACSNIRNLSLKIFVHKGEALLYNIQEFEELSGIDVILIHRLLKNSINEKEYILFTEEAYSYIEFPFKKELLEYKEQLRDIGEKRVLVYIPEGACKIHKKIYQQETFKHKYKNFSEVPDFNEIKWENFFVILKDVYYKAIKPIWDNKYLNKKYRYLNKKEHSINEDLENK